MYQFRTNIQFGLLKQHSWNNWYSVNKYEDCHEKVFGYLINYNKWYKLKFSEKYIEIETKEYLIRTSADKDSLEFWMNHVPT